MNPQNNRPIWYGPPPPARRQIPVAARFTIGVALLALIAWGTQALWTHGLGTSGTFRQHNLAGNAAAERGDFQTANDEYSQMIALRPDRHDGYLLRAISEFQAGQMPAAIRDNTAALDLTQDPVTQDPETRGDLFYNRAEAYAREGRLANAIRDYTQAAAEYPQEQNPPQVRQIPSRQEDCFRQRSDVYWQHKDYALAISDSSAAIAFGHARPQDYGVRGKAEAALGQYAAAQADLTQAIRLDPTSVEEYITLGELDQKRHQQAAAVALFQAGVQANPSSETFWGELGWVQYEAGQLPQAIQSDQHARSLDAKPAWVTYNLALVYAAEGQTALSQTAYRDALSRSTPPERQGALADIRHALAAQPAPAALPAAALRQALALVTQGGTVGQNATQSVAASLPVLPPPQASSPPVPPAGFAARLGPEVILGGYGIQPPRGYTLTQRPQVTLSSSGTQYLWSGPARENGTVPTLEVVVAVDDGSLAAHSTSLQNAQLAVDLMQRNHLQLTETPAVSRPINGLPFAQASWNGFGLRTWKRYQGSEYWLVSPSVILHLATHDAASYDQQTMPLLNASVSTFRKL